MSAAPKADEIGMQAPPVGRDEAASALWRLFLLMAALCVVLGPLVGMLLSEGGAAHIIMACLVFLCAAGLWAYSGRLVFRTIRLKAELATLQRRLDEARTPVVVPHTPHDGAAFAAEISRALRTPLTALVGMAQLLDRADLVGPPRNHVKVMLDAGRALQLLLDDIVALTQGASSDGVCDPAQAARAVSRLLQPLAWEKRLRLTVTPSPNLPRVAADPRRVRQALCKLVENGLKFTENGEVSVRVEPVAATVRFTVTDTGSGVAAELRAYLFASPGDGARRPNSGLGLAVVKHIVERAGGSVGFESRPGRGASFWFTLPVVARATEPADLSPKEMAPSGLRLLVVSDDEAVVQPLSVLLASHDNRLEAVHSVADAASRAGRTDYDAIVVGAADADSLAASPGVRAPILALLLKDDRRPHCADDVILWPSDPGLLYAALARLCAPQDSGGEEKSESPPVDTATVMALEKSVGTATLVDILRSYIVGAEQLCAAIEAASQEGRWDEAARLARDIAGSASGLGLAAMTATARAFAADADRGGNAQGLRNGAHAIFAEHGRTRGVLSALYPDLVA
ncbi:MAG: hypothetical protein KGJ78_03280 [Alphaproteobacteria bacterium]|nr:hypothetical protein [Alphaproteobacteria bacterium]